MEIREIKTFLQAAQSGSFVKAAQTLGYSQAAVTIQIKHLEEELGTVLFDRIGKQTQLTESGRTFQVSANRIIQEIEEAKAEVRNAPNIKGTLRIGTIESIGAVLMPELITRYHSCYPGVNIEMELDSPQNLMEHMNKNQLDMVYLLESQIFDTTCTRDMEVPENVVAVVNPQHPLCEKENLVLNDILKHDIILTEKGASYRKALEYLLAKRDQQISPFLTVGSTEFIIQYLKSHNVVSFLPEFTVKEELEEGTLKRLHVHELESEEAPLRVWRQLLYRKDKWVNPQMKAFIELIKSTEEAKN